MIKTHEVADVQPPGFFRVIQKGKGIFLAVEDIQLITSSDSYTHIHTAEGVYVYTKNMRRVYDYLVKQITLIKLGRTAYWNPNHPADIDYCKCRFTVGTHVIDISCTIRWNLHRLLHLKGTCQPYPETVDPVKDISAAGERMLRMTLSKGDPKEWVSDLDTIRFCLALDTQSAISTARSLEKKGLIHVEVIGRIVYASSLDYQKRRNQLTTNEYARIPDLQEQP
ncbi:MAG: hypothetical protein EOO39_02250 [Cytophagaceae bacterium]|nr:MAG: hypothetical protein EOO39_02250 [Cytophagaceae bacterium]